MKLSYGFALLLFSFCAGAQPIVLRDTIPFLMNDQSNIYVRAVFNKTDTLNLNFDTGTTELVLINSVLKGKLVNKPTLYTQLYTLQIGQTTYQTKVYDAELTAQETDGRFGWDLFNNKIVELDYDKRLLIVHAQLPTTVIRDKKYTKLPITFFKDLLLVPGSIKQNGVINKELFLVDTGYQRTVMLDNDLLKQSKFPAEKMPLLKKVVMHGAQGNEIPVLTTKLTRLQIGRYALKNVPVQQIIANKPVKDKNMHILGNEVLKRFNMLLDLQSNVVYLAPNHFYRVSYVEDRKSTPDAS